MPYLNLDVNYFDHIKTVRLIGLLGKGAAELPIRLWAYCGKHRAKDGNLAGYSAQEIETIIGWWGNTGGCIEALIKTGFLERTSEGYQVHEWNDHEGHLVTYHERAKVAAKARWNPPSMLQAMLDDEPSNAPTIPTNPPNQPNQLNARARDPDYKVPLPEKDPTGAIVIAYKVAKGVAYDDRTWDKTWGRWSKAAANLLEIFAGNFKLAVRCLDEKGKELTTVGKAWTLETIVAHAHDWKNKQGGTNGRDDRQRLSRAVADARAKAKGESYGGFAGAREVLAGVRGLPNAGAETGPPDRSPGNRDEPTARPVPKNDLETGKH